jgi:aquaporin Z
VSDADREVVFTVPALFAGGWALEQLWLFWLAPIVGAAIAGIVYPLIAGETKEA